MISQAEDDRRRVLGSENVNNRPAGAVSKLATYNDSMLKSGGTQADVTDPSPVTYLRTLFAKTERGREILRGPNRCMFSKPSPDTIAAYDMEAVQAIRTKDVGKLRSLLQEGKSMDACNRFGESLIHMTCRRGDIDVVRFMTEEAGVQVNVRDDFGRLPLHDATVSSLKV